MDIIRRILGLVGDKRKQFVWSLLLILVIVASRLIGPFITRVLVDDVIGQSRTDLLAAMLVALLGLTVLRSSMQYLRGFLSENVSQFVVYHMRRNLYRHLQELPFRFYDQHQIGDIMSRMTSDIEGIRHFLSGGIPQLLDCVIMFVGAIVMLFSMNAILALVALISCPFIAVVGLRFDKSIRPIYREIREQNAVLSTQTRENVSAVRVVKAFAMEEHEKETFRVENQKVLEYNLKAVRSWARFFPLMDFLSQITTPLLMLVGGGLVIHGDTGITLGMLVAFMGYMWMISMPLRMLGQLINMVENTISSAEKIFYYTDLGSSIREKPDATAPETARGHVTFEHVYFHYADTDVLQDISFDAPPGKTIAIMGATGSGKTTLVNLLARFYDVSSGRVLVDGIDVRDYQLQKLRRHIGYVFQDTFLFSDTMKDNVAFGVPYAGWDTIHHASDIAQASEFIANLPQGYDTIVGDRGLGLSGGQKQRTTIARAIAINPKILVLDDATSAVDMDTEYAIQKGLEQTMAERTTFIIAHRISSVRNADEILVLQDGKVAERGNHDTLLTQQGLYYQMYMDQYRDFETLQQSWQEEAN